MIYVLCFILIFIIIFIYFSIGDYLSGSPKKEYLKNVMAGIAVGMVGCLLFGQIGSMIIQKNQPTYKEIIANSEIVALNDSSASSGDFFLGSGYVESELYYVFMKKLNDGGFQMSKKKASTTPVYYSDYPQIIIYRNVYTNPSVKFWTWENSKIGEKYEIHVPKGTIKQNYNVDLQ